MTDNEIMQALECHADTDIKTCKICPYDGGEMCGNQMCRDALDLINRLQADKEALIAGQETLQKALAESEANFNEAAKRFYKEGVTDFAERLKNVYTSDKRYDRPNPQTMLSKLFYNITIVAKELRGDAE